MAIPINWKMVVDQEKLDKIRTFADRGRKLEKQYSETPLTLDAIQHYNRRLDDTIRSLQDHIKQQEDTLRKEGHMLQLTRQIITNVETVTCI